MDRDPERVDIGLSGASDVPEMLAMPTTRRSTRSPHKTRGAYQFTAEVSVYIDAAHHGCIASERMKLTRGAPT